jgi:hypothetical protein
MEAEMRKSRSAACVVMLLLLWCGCGSEKSDSSLTPPGGFDNPELIAGQTGGGAGNGLPLGTCANGLVVATRDAPRVVLVLDGSCSMSTDYPANGKMSATTCTNNIKGRWSALRKALIDPESGVVPKLQSVVEFGVVVFGTAPTCPIPGEPVRPALNNLATIAGKMPMVQPGMYTPTGPALDWVYQNLIESDGPDSRGAPQVVILATDGEPNSCGGAGMQGGQVTTNYQPSIDAVKQGTQKGAKTYVISLADASGPFHDHLQQLANLGDPSANGHAVLYEPASPAQLEANLQSLVGAAVGCEIELNGQVESAAACTGSVKLDGAALGCNDPNGWMLLDASHIRLQGKACEKLKAKNDSSVEAAFSCTAFRPD